MTHDVSSLAFAQIMTPDPLTLLRLIRRRIAMYEDSQSLTGTVKYILSAAQIERLLDEFGGPEVNVHRLNAGPISETRDGAAAAVLVTAPCIAGEDDSTRGTCRDSMVWCIESGDLPRDEVNSALVAIAQRTAVVWMHTHPPPCPAHVFYANYRRDNPRGLVLARWDHLCRATGYVCDWADGESTWTRGLFE